MYLMYSENVTAHLLYSKGQFRFSRGVLMIKSACSRFNTATAAISGVGLALGLVVAPPAAHDSVIQRSGTTTSLLQTTASIQLASLTQSVVLSADTATGVDHPSTASATASATANPLQNLVIAGLALALAPVWYVGFPVTLPLSLLLGVGTLQLFNLLPRGFGAGGSINPVTMLFGGALAGLGIFAAGPLAVAFSSISSLASPTSAAATTASAIRTGASARRAANSIAARSVSASGLRDRSAAASSRRAATDARADSASGPMTSSQKRYHRR